jgi:hypothetical protein
MATGSPKSKFVADVINKTLRDLVVRCTREEGVRDYFDVGVIGYGDAQVRNGLGGPLAAAWQLAQPMPGTHQITGGLSLHARHHVSTDTTTATRSPCSNNRASSCASRASVFTRSPGARMILLGAATSHRIPPSVSSRAGPNPVGPAS